MNSMYELRDMLCEELDKIAKQGELSAGSLDTVHKLTGTIKNIDEIEMLEDEGSSHRSSYQGRSYRGSYARGGSYDGGGSYDSGYSGRRTHYVRGHYSRDDGRGQMMEQLQEMMHSAKSEKERDALQRCMSQLEKA